LKSSIGVVFGKSNKIKDEYSTTALTILNYINVFFACHFISLWEMYYQ